MLKRVEMFGAHVVKVCGVVMESSSTKMDHFVPIMHGRALAFERRELAFSHRHHTLGIARPHTLSVVAPVKHREGDRA